MKSKEDKGMWKLCYAIGSLNQAISVIQWAKKPNNIKFQQTIEANQIMEMFAFLPQPFSIAWAMQRKDHPHESSMESNHGECEKHT